MSRFQAQMPTGSRLAVLDVVLVIWTVTWAGIGIAVAQEVDGLASLSDTVVRVGGAVAASGEALQTIENLPFVGETLDAPAERIQEAGEAAVQSGRESKDSIENLSTLLGLAIGIIPSLPVLGFYVPLRVSQVRERRFLARALVECRGDAGFEAFLAHRAVQHLPYSALFEISERPWADLAEGRHEALARAELDRFGLGRPSGRRTGGLT